MPHTLSYNASLQIIEIKIEGAYYWNEAMQVLHETINMIKAKDCFLIRTDLREADIRISTAQQFDAPQIFKEAFTAEGINANNVKRAVVTKKITEDHKFAENVAVNRLQQVRIFENMDAAKTWLFE